MDLKAVIEYLKANNGSADMVSFLETLKTVNIDSVKEYLEKDEAGKKYLQSITDAQVTKGIETFKSKTMPSLIEEEIKRKFPAETEDQKKLRSLEENQAKLQNEIKRKDLLNKAISLATEKKLPLRIIDRFLGDDEETTIKNIELLESEYNGAISKEVETKFKGNGRDTGNTGNVTPPADFSKMTDEQYFQTRLQEQKK